MRSDNNESKINTNSFKFGIICMAHQIFMMVVVGGL
jgi:hypothetical protein